MIILRSLANNQCLKLSLLALSSYVITWVRFMSKGPAIVVKVGRKGVVVLPKALRELVGIEEKSLVILGVEEGRIIIKPLKVIRVEATKKARRGLEEALSEEYRLEEEKTRRIVGRK